MRLLGLDIGTKNIGWATMADDEIKCGTISDSKPRIYSRLNVLSLHVDALIDGFNPNFVGIEDVWIGPNRSVAIKLAKAFGAAAGIAWRYGAEVFAFQPRQTKKALTGSGKASKEDVFGEASKIAVCDSQDAADAIAVLVALNDFVRGS